MRVSILRVLCLGAFAFTSFADFHYVTTIKSGGPAAGTVTKHYIKGSKMKLDSGDTATIADFESQTLISINHKAKTYSTTPLTKAGEALTKSGVELKADLKETGQSRRIGGFNCRQVILTMVMSGEAPTSMVMENEMWVSTDVPGAAEQRNVMERMVEKGVFPGVGDGPTKRMMVDLQRQMAKVKGVPVLQITRMKSGNSAQDKQMQAQMAAARQQMEAMKKMGGKQAEIAERALASMPVPGAKYLMEITSESSAFSTASIPASEFSIPSGYKKVDR